LSKHHKKDEAVSPVIAVILMVAITVVLAAVVYVWVSGFSGENVAPRSMSVQMRGTNETDAIYLVTSASPSLQWTELEFSHETIAPESGYVTAGETFTVHDDDTVSGLQLVVRDVPANAVILTLSIR
jgi:flagellin-like protein